MVSASLVGKHVLYALGSLSVGIFGVVVYPTFVLLERSISSDIARGYFPKAIAFPGIAIALLILSGIIR